MSQTSWHHLDTRVVPLKTLITNIDIFTTPAHETLHSATERKVTSITLNADVYRQPLLKFNLLLKCNLCIQIIQYPEQTSPQSSKGAGQFASPSICKVDQLI